MMRKGRSFYKTGQVLCVLCLSFAVFHLWARLVSDCDSLWLLEPFFFRQRFHEFHNEPLSKQDDTFLMRIKIISNLILANGYIR